MDQKAVTFRRLVGISAILLSLLLAALACNFQAPQDDSMRQTDVALGIQQTQLAQTASALVVESNKPTQAVVYVTATPAAPAPGMTPVAATPTEAPPPAATPLPAATTAAPTGASTSQEQVAITDWRLNFFAPIGSGCKVADAGCWRMLDDFKKHYGAELSLVSKTPVLVDASWPRPYLVFWHKYKFENKARIDVHANGTWSTVLVLDGQKSSNTWKQGALNLDMFKGKEIIINFAAYGIWGSGGIKGSDWIINDVQVIPNYTP